MSALDDAAQSESRARPAFDLFQGFATSNVLASLEMAGLLDELQEGGIKTDYARRLDTESGPLLDASLRYLAQRGLVREEAGNFELTGLGREVCRDKGYLVWLAGGYGESLRHLDVFLSGAETYGVEHSRDGRWVAEGAAMLGRQDVVPQAMELLETVTFDQAMDLGCGNARFLLSVCRKFGCDGVGVDLSPEACHQATKAVEADGMDERVEIVCGDAVDLDEIPSLSRTGLVVAFFLLHEILAHGRSVLVDYLSDMASRLPSGAYLLMAEVEPPQSRNAANERFTPEFNFVHAMMRQTLLSRDDWRAVLQEGGFTVRRIVRAEMPGGLLILCQTSE